ncbi:gamma-glutamylcyclotransferase [Phormidium sp. FACHB-1136]|jgi:gamma-glutamylaminecyclotransferase|uniref:allophanate hydrolase-related protein n=1 Tax=Phormidium sp. FACHB-1136 TaxID=2692848 RepID=UPI00168A3283|nr:gamma-glutamylcyclotransferase [Phormidium sp. FACHB-1136]MBD2424608.1 gamma-glutamylcyclotransferase [Phormidium sp. FACHB-1136]
MTQPSDTITVFICGSALRGQPDNQNLQDATFGGEAQTAPIYRLHSVKDGWHPGIYEVGEGGISIPGELYAMTPEQYTYLKDNEPPHMYPEQVKLVGGGTATAFLYPKALIDEHGWPDISEYGGWAAYKAATKSK